MKRAIKNLQLTALTKVNKNIKEIGDCLIFSSGFVLANFLTHGEIIKTSVLTFPFTNHITDTPFVAIVTQSLIYLDLIPVEMSVKLPNKAPICTNSVFSVCVELYGWG